jgi:hypothetical protein
MGPVKLERLLIAPLLLAGGWQATSALAQAFALASSAFTMAEKSSPALPSAAKAS